MFVHFISSMLNTATRFKPKAESQKQIQIQLHAASRKQKAQSQKQIQIQLQATRCTLQAKYKIQSDSLFNFSFFILHFFHFYIRH
jgi:hypothetical protein